MGDLPVADSEISKSNGTGPNPGDNANRDSNAELDKNTKEPIAAMRADTQDGTKVPASDKLKEVALIATGLLTNFTIIGEGEKPLPAAKNKGEPNLQDNKDAPAKPATNDAPAKPAAPQTPKQIEDARRARVIQTALLAKLPDFANVGDTQPVTLQNLPQKIQDLQTRTKAIQEEQKDGAWGPASQKAYGQYQKWYHEVLLRNVGDTLNSLGLDLPAELSLPLKIDSYGLPENPQLFRAALARGTRTPEALPEAAQALENKQFQSFLDGQDLMRKAAPIILETAAQIENKLLAETIKQNHYPTGWLKGMEEDPIKWHDAAVKMIQLANDTKNMLETMDHISRASKNNSLPFVPPSGTTFTRDANGEIARHADGTIKGYGLDLPAGVFEEYPANVAIVGALRDWHKEYGSDVEQAKKAYIAAITDPDRILSYGNEEVTGKVARIVPVKQENGTFKDTFIGLANADESKDKTPMLPSETRKPCNLVCNRAWIEKNIKGEQIIVQSSEAYQIPVLGVYNLIGTKVADYEKSQVLANDKFYAVKSDGEPQLVRGSRLDENLGWQKLMLRSGQTASMLMDVAMLASGLGEGLAVYRAAKAGTAGVTLASAAVRKELFHAGAKSFVAVAGMLDNAGAKEYTAGQLLQGGRSLYFIGDMAMSIPKSARSIFVKPIPTALELAKDQELKKAPWLAATLAPANWTFKGLETYFAYKAQADLRHLGPKFASKLAGERPRDLLHDALILSADSSSAQAARDARTYSGEGLNFKEDSKQNQDASKTAALENEQTVLDYYQKSIIARCSPDDKAKVESILSRTKTLLNSQADPKDLEKFKQELMSNFLLPNDELDKVIDEYMLNKAQSRLCPSNALVESLIDPAKRAQWSAATIHKTEDYDNKIGPNVRAAAVIALLTLSKQSDGSLPPTLTSKEYGYTIPEGEGGQKVYSFSLTTKNAVQILLRDFSMTDAGGREIAAGDLLTRIGAISGQQYALTLQDVLANPQATVTEKMEAAPRLATIMLGLRRLEEDNRQKNIPGNTGLTSTNIETNLLKIVQNDSNADVRAMSAALLYGANHPAPAYGEAFLRANNLIWQKFSTQAPGSYAKQMTLYLQEQTQKQSAKFNASVLLWDLSKHDDLAAQKIAATKLAECFTNTNTELSMRVIDALVPEGIKLLDQIDQNQANLVRKTALSLLAVPEVKARSLSLTREQEQQAAQAVTLMHGLDGLYKDASPQMKAQLCQKLEELIDPRRRYDNDKMKKFYDLQHVAARERNNCLPEANLFPDMQAAAINILAQNDSQNSISLIRAKLTGTVDFGQLAVKDVHTANPQVRLAALNALAALKDAQLNELIPQLISVHKENNSAVAGRLYDLQVEFPSSKQPLEKDKERHVHDTAVKDYTPIFASTNGKIFERDAYSLLEYDKFAEKVKAAVEESKFSRLLRWSDFSATEKTNIGEAGKAVNDTRWSQWQALCSLSKMQENNKDDNYEHRGNRDEAIEGLDKVLKKLGRPLAKPDGKSAEQLEGFSFHASEDSVFWSKKAATALVDGLENGFAKDKFANSILTGLEDSNVDAEAKMILADGAEYLVDTKFSRMQLADSLERIFTNLPKAHNTSTIANNMLKTRLLKDFGQYMYRNSTTIGLLKAIAENDSSPGIKELAKDRLAIIQKSYQKSASTIASPAK